MDTARSPRGREDGGEPRASPRVCAVVLMNHPFPQVLPLLRRIYAGRFATVRFLVPFERLPDEDVITVYRAPYCHAGFLTDARERLAAIDCDHYLVLHDDVLLNPRIDEASFYEHFPLGAGDGFFPTAGTLSYEWGAWEWYATMVLSLLCPKSLLFGTGVEPKNIVAYLPDAQRIRERLAAAGLPAIETLAVSEAGARDILEQASRFLFYGLAARVPLDDPAHAALRDDSAEAIKALMALAGRAAVLQRGPDASLGAHEVRLPFPVLRGGFYTDLYVVPKRHMADYAHYMGVASSANLLTEMMAPLILYTICDRVLSAEQCGLSLAAFNKDATILRMLEADEVMTHPIKLSAVLADEETERRLFRWLAAIRSDGPEAALGPLSFGTAGRYTVSHEEGWHGEEVWGRWSRLPEATLSFWAPSARARRGLRVRVQAPLHPRHGFTAQVRLNDGAEQHLAFAAGEPEIRDVVLPGEDLRAGAVNVVTVRSDLLVSPHDADPASHDTRPLGLAVWEIELL